MTLEILRKPDDWANQNPKPYKLYGVEKIKNGTGYGNDTFSITIFGTVVFVTELFQHIKNADTGETYIMNGKWVYERSDEVKD